ncbi:Hypothetical protein NTJ_07821 [Nesidiocoris tenuis]|uniref:Uncharacterized protein n=1 Tax=Nesidiocoris tenuis TaxID=355587 RepID=A0ABN7AUF6_9HEMI|nr:Hypothetical protein NTJ_07821 [Nesidiocoris tenuis]
MDDTEIQATVESLLGKGAKVVDCEKKSTIREEEVLLVNGCPVRLDGTEGAVIRDALLTGSAPHSDLLNRILIRAGVLSAPVRLETSLSVKSSVVTREHVTVARGGRIVDGRTRETKEDNYYDSNTAEVWVPESTTSTTPSTTSSSTDEVPVWEPIPASTASSLTSISKEPPVSSPTAMTSASTSSCCSSSSVESTSSSSSIGDDLDAPLDRLNGLSISSYPDTSSYSVSYENSYA